MGNFRTRALTLGDMDMEEYNDRINVLVMGLKCADLGHSAKSTELHEKWT